MRFFCQWRQKGVSGPSRGNSAIFELHTPDFAWKLYGSSQQILNKMIHFALKAEYAKKTIFV